MRALLTAICAFTLLALAWLTVMFVVLRRPGYVAGLAVAVLLLAQSAVALGIARGRLSALPWRLLGAVGAVLSGATGLAVVRQNLIGRHFEGYAVVIGLALVVQAVLTLAHLITNACPFSTKVHASGN